MIKVLVKNTGFYRDDNVGAWLLEIEPLCISNAVVFYGSALMSFHHVGWHDFWYNFEVDYDD